MLLPVYRSAKVPPHLRYVKKIFVGYKEVPYEDRIRDRRKRKEKGEREKEEHGKRRKIRVPVYVYKEVEPEWKNWPLEKRIKEQKGIIHNPSMEGTYFWFRYEPILSGGKVVRIRGNFSGRAKYKSGDKVKTVLIEGGAYEISILNPR